MVLPPGKLNGMIPEPLSVYFENFATTAETVMLQLLHQTNIVLYIVTELHCTELQIQSHAAS